MARPAVHRTILVVDVAGFGDRRRTNLHQVAVREGLYRVLTQAFLDAGIPWGDCDHEDRGDGVLVVIPPSVAKSLLVESLPRKLISALRAHNRARCAEEQIRLRLALHAGEMHYDDHGVVGRAVNLAFRLLDAPVLKDTLAESAGTLAIITSSWFFEEVVWHSNARDRAEYHQVRVTVKETETTAWICLPDVKEKPRTIEVWATTTSPPSPEQQHSVPRQLPARSRQFVGRKEEIDQLTGLLDSATHDAGTVIITAIDGTAGIGKTTLALYWAHQVKDRFPDGQLYANLRGFDPQAPMSPNHALRSFLHALGVAPSRIPADLDAKAALYRTLVAARRLLIVLDNARSTEDVRELLPGTATCLVIITSRNRLDSLAVRDGAHRIALNLLSTRDAFELIAKRVNRERAAAEPQATAALVNLCARLPLALSIVAARAATQPALPLSRLVRELRDERGRLNALDLGHPDLDLRAVFSWSYNLLSSDAARLFRLLGVHPGPDIDPGACAALIGDSAIQIAALLRELTGAHLLEEHNPDRFRFHDLLRTYASEQAEHDETNLDRAEAMRRVLDYYSRAALLADFHIQPCRDGVVRTTAPVYDEAPTIATYTNAMEWFTAENATLLAMIASAARHEFDSHAERLAWACTIFLRRTGQLHERVAIYRIAVAAARRSGDPAIRATSVRHLARAIARVGQHEEAHTLLDEALTTYEALGDDHGNIQTHLAYASVLEAQHQHADALKHALSAWQLAKRTDNRLHHADTLTVISRQEAWLGRYIEALPLAEEALALYCELQHPEGEADTLVTIGYIRQHLGEYAKAITCYKASLARNRQLGDQYWEAFALNHLGDAHQATDDVTQARSAWRQALRILEDLRLPGAEGIRAKLALPL